MQANDPARWTIGAALGGHFNLTEAVYFEPDISWQYVKSKDDKFWGEESDNIMKLRLLAGWQFSEAISVYAGPTFNFFLSKYNDGGDLAPWSISEDKSDDYWTRSWIGFNAGIRF